MEEMYPQFVAFKLYDVPVGKTSKKKIEVQRTMGRKGKAVEVTEEDEEEEVTDDEEDEADESDEDDEDTPAYVTSASVPAVPPTSALPVSAARVPVVPAALAAAGASSASALSTPLVASSAPALSTAPVASPASAAPVPAAPAASASTTPTLYLDRAAYDIMKDKKRNTFEGKYSIPLRDESGRVPLMIPGSGPWMFGDKEILPCARALWFHAHREDYPRFCRTLVAAQALASGKSPKNHRDAEALWIKEHFAIVSNICV